MTATAATAEDAARRKVRTGNRRTPHRCGVSCPPCGGGGGGYVDTRQIPDDSARSDEDGVGDSGSHSGR